MRITEGREPMQPQADVPTALRPVYWIASGARGDGKTNFGNW